MQYFLEPVEFDYSLLSGNAKAAVDKLDEYPTEMHMCTLPASLYSGTGQHQQYLLINNSRSIHQNTVDHFKNHASVKMYMEAAQARGEDLESAAESCMEMLNVQKTKPGGSSQTRITSFTRKNATEKLTVGLLDRERKELAVVAFLIGTQCAPNKLAHKTWADVKHEMRVDLAEVSVLRSVHYPIVFEAIRLLRMDIFKTGGFVHTEFDFLTVNNTKYLLVAGRTVLDFVIFSDILGVVHWSGFGGAEHVAHLANLTVDRTVPDSVLLCANVVDGALLSASNEYVGEEDTIWCFSHGMALPVKKSLSIQRNPTCLVCLDFNFMHEFGVFVRAHADLVEIVDRLRKAELGNSKGGTKLLLDCLARWESEKRKVCRFVELKGCLIEVARRDDVKRFVADLVKSNLAPRDALKPAFWTRIEAMHGLILQLYAISKASQSEKSVVASLIPYWVNQMRDLATLRQEDEPQAVLEWKRRFLGLVNEQFESILTESSPILLSCLVDPRFADVNQLGVSKELEAELWDTLVEEHLAFKVQRGKLTNDNFELKPAARSTAQGFVESLRDDFVPISKQFQQDLLAGKIMVTQ